MQGDPQASKVRQYEIKGGEEGLREYQQQIDWQQEQNTKTNYKGSKIRDLFPSNFNSERDKFMEQGGKYNPQFTYSSIVSPQVIPIHTEHQQIAINILQNNKYKPSSQPVLTQAQVEATCHAYLDQLGLAEYVQLRFQPDLLSRTSVSFFKERIVMKMRVPLGYTAASLQGVLNHEVGTHIIRRLNHRQNCIRKPSPKGKLLQQGLASINQMINQEQPFLFKPALRYMAAIWASRMGFAQVYALVSKYMTDTADCWRECVRVKRGLTNTQLKGGLYKDQSYLIGAVELLKNRKNIDFRKIFYGKLSPEQTVSLSSGVLPPFVASEEKYRYYCKKLDAIALCNYVDEQH